MKLDHRRHKVIDGTHGAGLGINLRHLRALSAVAAAGSIAGAAEDLYRVPSAVTRSISELEGALGRPPVRTPLARHGAERVRRAGARARSPHRARVRRGPRPARRARRHRAHPPTSTRCSRRCSTAGVWRWWRALRRSATCPRSRASSASRSRPSAPRSRISKRGSASSCSIAPRAGSRRRRPARSSRSTSSGCSPSCATSARTSPPAKARCRAACTSARCRSAARRSCRWRSPRCWRAIRGCTSRRSRARTKRWRHRCAAAISTSSSARCAAMPRRRTCSRRRCSRTASR